MGMMPGREEVNQSSGGLRRRRYHRRFRSGLLKVASLLILKVAVVVCYPGVTDEAHQTTASSTSVEEVNGSSNTRPSPQPQQQQEQQRRRKLYQPRRYHPPSRPDDAPPIDYDNRHPFDYYYADDANDPNHRVRRRALNSSPSSLRYEPIRIKFDISYLESKLQSSLYDPPTSKEDSTKLYLIIHKILPAMSRVWSDILRVVPVQGGIYPLHSTEYSTSSSSTTTSSSSSFDEEGKENNDLFAKNQHQHFCPQDKTSGIDGNADLLVYVTVDRHNCNVDVYGEDLGVSTLASAIGCERDQYDRPITGTIDFCLDSMLGVTVLDVEKELILLEEEKTKEVLKQQQQTGSGGGDVEAAAVSANYVGSRGNGGGNDTITNTTTNTGAGGKGTFDGGVDAQPTDEPPPLVDPSDPNKHILKQMIGVAIHEFGHVLGMSSDSIPYFRHPQTGKPLTSRPFKVSTVTCVNGERVAYMGKPSTDVLQESQANNGIRHYEVVTPTVRSVVQNQFNCPTLNGARLENQPTSTDCFGSHWDERLFYTETMGAIYSHIVNVLSPLTVALLEDSGWYQANYESRFVNISPFGHGAGCDFVYGDCIVNGQVPNYGIGNFCTDVIRSVTTNTNNQGRDDNSIIEFPSKQRCDPSYHHKASCDLVDSRKVTNLDMAPNEQFRYFAPDNDYLRPYAFARADYCPIPSLNTVDCTSESGGWSVSREYEEAGETYGTSSRCVEVLTRDQSICLETKCNVELGKVQLIVMNGIVITCDYDGQVHTVLDSTHSDDTGIEEDEEAKEPFRIQCPKLAQICPNLLCPSNCSGRGKCLFEPKHTGDPHRRGVCQCNDRSDRTLGCYQTTLSFPDGYGDDGNDSQDGIDQAEKVRLLLFVGLVVTALAVLFCVYRAWQARQRSMIM